MRIGILGTGNMADALAGQWARRVHEITIGGRDLDRAGALATKIGASAGTLSQAAAFGDVVLLAVPHSAVPAVLDSAALDGQIVVDCTNPVVPGRFVLSTNGQSAAEAIVTRAPSARVVKAFNLCHVDVWRMRPPVFEGRPLAVPLCGDDPDAIATVASLVSDLGCHPVNGGRLERAGLLEATAAFMIGLWMSGEDAQAVLPPLEFAEGAK
jgi:predicted dinucleotide-binding enzyme